MGELTVDLIASFENAPQRGRAKSGGCRFIYLFAVPLLEVDEGNLVIYFLVKGGRFGRREHIDFWDSVSRPQAWWDTLHNLSLIHI